MARPALRTVALRSGLPLLILAPLVAGCVGAQNQDGIRIGDRTLEQFKAGETTENWVRAILGEPTSTAAVEGEPGVSVLRYTMTQDVGGGITSLFTGSARTAVATIYFIVRDGKVEEFWADRQEESGLFGKDEKSGAKED